MDNWAPTVVYQLALDRYNEDLARGTASQQLQRALGIRPLRARLANALVALAARLDAASRPMLETPAALAPLA